MTKKSVRKRATKKKARAVKRQTRDNTGAKKVGPAPKPKRQKPETGQAFKPKPKPTKTTTTKRAQRHQRRG